MKYIAALLVSTLFFASPLHAETPCDFKGVSVGNKMAPAEIMAALGVTKYKTNPPQSSFEEMIALAEKYGTISAGELLDWKIGPYCKETSCLVPYGIAVGNNNTPVHVFIAFHEGLITEIDVSFGEMYWDEMLPILDQKYGADWKVEREMVPITNYETKKPTIRESILLNHISNGVNRRTNGRCQIWAQNLDMVFEHHDAYGRYHSV